MPSGLAGDIDTAVDTVAQVASQTQSTPSGSAPPPAKAAPAKASQPSAVRGSGDTPVTPSSPPGVQGQHPQSTRPNQASSVGTTTPPSAEVNNDPEAVLKETSPIPVARLPQILDNTRKKEAERLTQIYGVSPDNWQSQNLGRHVQGLTTNPVQYYRELGDLLKSHGLLADATPPPSPSATPSVPTEMPKPDLRAEDGRLAYSAEATQALVAWQLQNLEKKFSERYAPVESEVSQVREQRIQSTAQSHAQSMLNEAATWPDFADVKSRVLELMKSDGRRTLETAYVQAMKEHAPQQKAKMREGILSELRTAPPVPSTTAPSSTVPRTVNGTGRRKMSLDERFDSAIATALDRHAT